MKTSKGREVNMTIQKHREETKLVHQVAPLIDVVFLLLIYFMVTSSLIRKESDISFQLPGPPGRFPPVDLPVDAYIQIDAVGAVSIAGMQYDTSDAALTALTEQLTQLRLMADSQHAPFFVTLDPDDATLHSRVVDVLDACAAAKVKNLTFARNTDA